MHARRTRCTTTALVVLAATACAGGTGARNEPAARPDAESLERLEAIYRARQDSARARFTRADVRFMTGMIAHHAQALLMSRLAPDRVASPSVQTLAARIINAQRDEITLMQQWLRERGQPVPDVHVDVENLTVHGPSHAEHAPGMLTAGQLRELEAARGRAFDRLFLRYMIQHHRGAVTMVHHLFGQEGAGQDEAAFKLASDIQVDQITEIARMEDMLGEMPDPEGIR